MSGMLTGPVVVGVDGSGAGLAAVRYAALQARRAHAPLRIAHVLPSFSAINPMLPLSGLDAVREVGERIVQAARSEAEPVVDHRIGLTTGLLEGRPTAALVRDAQDARMIVLGRSDARAGHFFTGHTLIGVASRAGCPVVAVPEHWRPSPGRIVVGVTDVDSAPAVLAAAFDRAAASGEGLLFLQAWKLDSAYEDIIFERVRRDEIRQTAQESIAAAIAGLRATHPDISAEIEVVHGTPAAAIVNRSVDASLVMLGRRSHHARPAPYLGVTTRVVLHHASCPIEVVPLSVAGQSDSG